MNDLEAIGDVLLLFPSEAFYVGDRDHIIHFEAGPLGCGSPSNADDAVRDYPAVIFHGLQPPARGLRFCEDDEIQACGGNE
jgi:hypothetical protein